MMTNTKHMLSAATMKPIIKEIMRMQPDQEIALSTEKDSGAEASSHIHVKAVTINDRRFVLVATDDVDVAWCVDMGEYESYPDELRAEKRLAIIFSGLIHF